MNCDPSAKPPQQLVVDTGTACALLGGISRWHLWRLVSSGRLPVVRLPGARDRRSTRGTTDASRRVFYAVDDLQRLVNESKERAPAQGQSTVLSMRKKKGAA